MNRLWTVGGGGGGGVRVRTGREAWERLKGGEGRKALINRRRETRDNTGDKKQQTDEERI